MSFLCNCDVGLANLGTPSCVPLMNVTNRLIMVPLIADDGTPNGINITDTLDAQYFNEKVNNPDPSKRWYPTPSLENVEDTKADSVFESLNSGKNIFIKEGVRTFNGVFIKEGPVFLGKLKSGRCVKFGVLVVDQDRSIIGKKSADGTMLRPLAVDEDTWNPVLMKPTDTTSLKVSLSFEFARTERDENIRMITADNIEGIDLTDPSEFSGLLDVNAVISGEAVTGFTAKLTFDYGDLKTPINFKGAVVGDFVLTDKTDDSVITITSADETDDGLYAFEATLTSGDYGLTLSKDGFEMKEVIVTIP